MILYRSALFLLAVAAGCTNQHSTTAGASAKQGATVTAVAPAATTPTPTPAAAGAEEGVRKVAIHVTGMT